MKSRLQWALFIACASAALTLAHPQSRISGTAGIVRGTVSGDGLGRLEGVSIVIEGDDTSWEVITDDNGEFQASVPSGVYSIHPKFLPDDPRHGRFRRAKFLVVPRVDTVIDLSPFAGFDYCSQRGERLVDLQPSAFGSPRSRKLPSPNYDTYLIRQASGEPLDLVIDFCKREKKGDVIIYKSVAVSFNDMTLYADTVSLRPRDLLLQLVSGNATLISAGESKEVTRFSSFIGTRTFIELSDGFTESVNVHAKLHSHNISCSLDIERGGSGSVFYEDREKDVTLVAEGESLRYVSTESPYKMKLSGYGYITSKNLSLVNEASHYANFTITIESKSKRRQPSRTLSIEIPSIKGYNVSGVIPHGSVKIRREPKPNRIELADSIN